MRARPYLSPVVACLVVVCAAAAVPVGSTDPDLGPAMACDKAYFFSPEGKYLGSQCFDYPGADGSRFACIPGGDCSFCGACHTPAQRADKAWLARTDRQRHRDVHFPKVAVALRAGVKLAWGSGAHLRLQRNVMTITSSAGKDLAVFPAGSSMFLDAKGAVKLVLLPKGQELELIP